MPDFFAYMYVIIDIGNTLTKVATFEGDRMLQLTKLKDSEVITYIDEYKLYSGLISTVRNGELTHNIQKKLYIIFEF